MDSGAVGFIEAWPNPCPIPEGASSGVTGLSWTSIASEAEVTLQALGKSEVSVSTLPAGSETLRDVWLGDQYTARLYDISGDKRTLLSSVIITSQASPAVAGPSGSLGALPNPCLLGFSEEPGTTLIGWRTHGTTQARVTLQIDAHAEDVFAESLGGQQPYTRLRPGHSYCFRLYDVSGGTRTLLDTLDISARVGAGIEATPNPCLIGLGSLEGYTSVAWALPGGGPAEVTVQARGGEERRLADVSRGHLPYSGVKLGGWYVFRLYDTSGDVRRLVDAVVVTGSQVEASRLRRGTISASPTLCVLRSRERAGTTVISWSTQSIPLVEVTMQTGEEETVLANSVTGTRTVSELRNDKPYVFRLYDVTGPGRRLLDGVVVAAL